MYNVTIDDSQFTLAMKLSSRAMKDAVRKGINRASDDTAKYIAQRHLTGGTTPDRLGVRTGTLRRSARGRKAVIQGNKVSGGVGLGGSLVYAPVHINRQGTKTTIKPKKAKFLAVPFRGYASRTGGIGYGWQKKTSPRDYSKGYLRLLKTKKGNLMMARVTGKSGSKTITPYYMLLRKVVVPARVFPEQVMRVRRLYIIREINNALFDYLGKKLKK